MTIACRRVYEESSAADGTRVLVGRVRPRGMRKEDAHLDEWLRDVAPSTELRRRYGHRPDRFPEFGRRCLDELRAPERRQAVAHLREPAAGHDVTLLTATKDVEHSRAAVPAERLGG
ncbi:DUF488 family protein [Streptomyces sp. AV19]|uniref:DUF488 domain-containing protein n=1 Tax=Streptomyces sp. AV19 TaxID=2793068 RepID=UPI0018FE1B4E|nr:DUF488 family protein [Streptomyces sp. AV19]MBH1937553.1 DUF488 family protein [Streptomyces sp. AV19]MDG4536439.1 DUF488 family protein [Streptomyces sp. AV19]